MSQEDFDPLARDRFAAMRRRPLAHSRMNFAEQLQVFRTVTLGLPVVDVDDAVFVDVVRNFAPHRLSEQAGEIGAQSFRTLDFEDHRLL